MSIEILYPNFGKHNIKQDIFTRHDYNKFRFLSKIISLYFHATLTSSTVLFIHITEITFIYSMIVQLMHSILLCKYMF